MSDTRRLVSAFRLYADYLDHKATATAQRRASGGARKASEHVEVQYVKVTQNVPQTYKLLNNKLSQLDIYEPLLLDDSIMLAAGADPTALVEEAGTRRSTYRYDFIRRMQLSYQSKIYSYDPKGGKEMLRFIWRVADVNDNEASTREARLITGLKDKVQHYLDRQTKAEFIARFSGVSKLTPAIIRNMIKCLTRDDSAASNAAGESYRETRPASAPAPPHSLFVCCPFKHLA